MAPKFGHLEDLRPAEVPADAKLEYQAMFVEMGERPRCTSKMSKEERIAAADEQNERGKAFFAEGNLKRAQRCYTKALEFVRYLKEDLDEEDSESQKVIAITTCCTYVCTMCNSDIMIGYRNQDSLCQ